MNAVEVLKASRETGVTIRLSGNNLVLEAKAAPSDLIVEKIKRHKSEIISLLRIETSSWSEEDWRALFDERAAIAEYDHGFSKSDAELTAFEDCLDRWLVMHPPAVDQIGSCLQCKIPLSRDHSSVIQVAGLGISGSLHANCASKWKVSRRIQARRKLSWLLGVGEMHDKS